MKIELKQKSILWTILVLVFSPFLSQASAYWMEIIGDGKIDQKVTVQLIYGSIDDFGIRHRQTDKELLLAGEFGFNLVDPAGKKSVLQFNQEKDCWEASFTPRDKGIYRILGINNTHPVVDRSAIGGESVLPIDYLCSQYVVGSAQGQSGPTQLLDITTVKEGSTIKVSAFLNNIAAKPKTKLRVFNPENWEKELVLDENGTAPFSPTMKGMYIIRLDWVEPRGGTYKGLSYSSIRHRCNYCLFVE